MFEVIAWGTVVRTGQIVVEVTPTYLCGVIVAGVLRRMLGGEGTRRLFGGRGRNGLIRAWAVGTLLPVCSLGVIPVAREMRRAGVPTGTVLAFVLAAPHINPFSLMYGLTLSEPVVIVAFACASLFVALAAGALWDRFFDAKTATPIPPDDPMPAPGLGRLLAVALFAAREAVGPSLAYVAIGAVATGAISGLLPAGLLGTTMKHDNPLSPLLMAAVALPLFCGPLSGMMRLGLMFEHGNSAGAAFVLFELGIGLNVGMIAWMVVQFGARRVFPWLAAIVLITLGLAYASERTLYFAKEEASHTHAFDEWTNPFHAGTSVKAADAWEKVDRKIDILEPAAMLGLLALVLLALAERLLRRRFDLEAWLLRPRPATAGAPGLFTRSLPGYVLGGAALLVLLGVSIAGAFVYYPPPGDVFRDMSAVRADALTGVNTWHREEAIRKLEEWDLLTRKLQVGVYLREGGLSREKADRAEDLRERLEDLRDVLLAAANDPGKREEAKRLARGGGPIDTAYRECRSRYGY